MNYVLEGSVFILSNIKSYQDESEHNSDIMLNIDKYLSNSVDNEEVPGAVILIVKDKKVQLHKEYGFSQIIPYSLPMNKVSIFDIASLTKVVAVWPAVMFLIDKGYINMDDELFRFYGDEIDSELKYTTIFQHLTHTSGLSERTYLKQFGNNKKDIMTGLLKEGLEYPPDKQVIYSNKGFIILGDIIEKVSGMSLDRLVKENIWDVLNMNDTIFNPDQNLIERIVSTEFYPADNLVKRGTVHDENAELLYGIAGHAGVFSTAGDIGKLCAMLLNSLSGEEDKIISQKLIKDSFINYTTQLNASRGLGWAIFHESENSKIVGHYGFTGTTIWIDLKKNMYTVLLTNRVHPSRENKNIHSIRAYVKELLMSVK